METYDMSEGSTLINAIHEEKQPEKKVEQSQMADFSTPIDEIIEEPQQGGAVHPGGSNRTKSGNPLGLTNEQFQSLIAGVAAVIAFSEPAQDKLSSFVPKFLSESGDRSMTGLIVTALVVAIIFYFAQKYLIN